MLNRSSIDRGMFVHTCYKTLLCEENKKTNCSFERIEVPPPKSQNKSADYSKLGKNGIAMKGVPVYKGDIIIGKTLTKVQKDEEEKIDCSLAVGNGEEGIVDEIWEGVNEEGYKMVKVRIRQLRTPEVGDKFASRSSQKGVCGLLLSQEDMPFTQEGISPDLLINPHCMPSRMTMSQLIEMLLGKTSALSGKLGDSTAFSKGSINPTESISKQLAELGFERHGNERLFSGYTGEMLQADIFIGTAYYQRLKHLVKDKMHCLTLDHQVLTLDGWRPIGELTTNDHVATLSQTTGVLEYQCPTNIWRYENYEGEMYHIKNQSIDISVTSKHRMWTSSLKGSRGNVKWTDYGFEEARDLVGKHRRYKKDAHWVKEDYIFSMPMPNGETQRKLTVDEMNAFLVFFGIWYAEGWASGKETYGRVTFSVNKKRVKDALFPSLEKLGYDYIFDEKTQKLYISNNYLYRYMKPLSVGAPQKKMPSWVMDLSKTQSQLLLESMILGDGCYVKSNPDRALYYTSSKQLADQFQQLCLHAGWASNISIHYDAKSNETYIKGRKIVNAHDVLRLSVIKSKVNPSVNHGHTHRQAIQEERFVVEKCDVMCITVPNEVFYVRRNGKAVWTGNSRARGNVTMMHHQPSEGRSKDGGLRTGEMERDALIAHGGSAFIQETFFDMSDVYQVNVCGNCGSMLSAAKECRVCKKGDVSKTNIPYCAKLLLQELQALGVSIKISTSEKKEK